MWLVWIRIRRKPLIAAAVLLFTALIAMALCALNRGNSDARLRYADIYHTIEVRCTVTNLAGDRSDRLRIPADMIALFGGRAEGASNALAAFVEAVQITGSTAFIWNGEEYTLTGLTSLQADRELWAENGCTLFWNGEMDESIFAGSGPVCIVPQSLAQKLQEEELPGDRLSLSIDGSYAYESDYTGELRIAGTYQSKNTNTVYCPWNTYAAILRSMGRAETADSLSAVLANNQDLEAFRALAAGWFGSPDPNAAGMEESNGYYFALDINDALLTQAKTDLHNSMTVNRIAVLLIFAISTAAGALIGSLMIRIRKREIVLMCSVGTAKRQIFGSLALEQMLCVILGAVVGGAYFRWEPVSWLVLFMCVYFVGLSAALLIFLGKNLLAIMKEE